MGSMAATLPNYQQSGPIYGTILDQRGGASGVASTGLTHQIQQIPPFAGQTHMGGAGYGIGIPSQFNNPFSVSQQNVADSQQYPQQQGSQRAQSGGSNPAQNPYTSSPYISNQQQQQQYMFYPSPYGAVSPSQQQYQGRSNVCFPQYHQTLSLHYKLGPQRPQVDVGAAISGNFPQASYSSGAPTGYNYGPGGAYLRPGSASGMFNEKLSLRHSVLLTGILTAAGGRKPSASGPGSIPSAPRGPPRKPKQSGHALWVGNLPPGTLVTDLKDHFSRDATNDIESVFLISKSNCAFVNYRSEAACAAAMTRFHDSRFQGIRLVCRLRRSSQAPSPGVPTGPAALSPSTVQTQSATEAIAQNRRVSSQAEEAASQVEGSKKVSDKYFVVKSLTVEDLELSVRNGIWTTQAHNEEALNKAFEVSQPIL